MKSVLLSAAVVLGLAASANATTLSADFTGVSGGTNVPIGGDFVADDLRIVGGNCATAPCAALNGPTDVTTIFRSSGLGFMVDSFWYQFLGNDNTLTVSIATSAADLMNNIFSTFAVFEESVVGSNNGGQTTAGPVGEIFAIRFDDTSSRPGNIRIDDLMLTVETAPIPLPAGGALLVTGLGGLAFARRRKSA